MPVTSGALRIRVSSEQREEIRRRAAASGKTISTYLREKALSNDYELHFMVRRIYEVLCLQKDYKPIKEEAPKENKQK
jgi:hypothetical protein